MVSTRLEISSYNTDGNFQSMPFAKDIPVVITYNLSDIREPDKRKASFSKTIQLPATNEINKLFENIFEVNIVPQYFNKNLKTPVKYYVNDILNFKGNLQLLKIVIGSDNNITYECSIVVEGGSLFVDIGEKLITGNPDSSDDLDFSAYDHTYSRANIISTRSNLGTGTGVLYPFVDRGTNGGYGAIWNTNDFMPCFSFYEYLKKIIEKTGKTFTSSILNSSLIKKSIVLPNIAGIPLTPAQLANRQFYVGLTSDVTVSNYYSPTIVNHDNESGIFYDAGSQVAGTIATINDNGMYNVAAHTVFDFILTHSDPTVVRGEFTGGIVQTQILYTVDSGATWLMQNLNGSVIQNGTGILNLPINTHFQLVNEVATGEIKLMSGTQLQVKTLCYGDTTPVFYNSSNTVVTTGTYTMTVKLKSGINGCSFYALATNKNAMSGNFIYANNALPIKIKQKDILKSVIQALNLYIDVDPNNENNLIIESFDTFYNTTTPVNYENKTDLNREQTINYDLLDGNRYIYTYKQDKDYYNDLYFQNFNEVYGTETLIIENDFKKTDKKNEIIFSATPNVANYELGIAHPRIFTKDGLNIKPITPNIRWLYCGGVMQSSNDITYKEDGQPDLITKDYLYAGCTDDPFNPTLDLSFGIPKQVYYSFPQAYFTNNNFYNRFHKQYLETLTSRDSKICTKYIWLNAKDINQFNFRNRIFIDDAYWIVNKIVNYDPLKEQSTQVELVKLIHSNVFVPTSVKWSDVSSSTGVGVLSERINGTLSLGQNIQNRGTNCIAIGDNIIIPSTCSNVTVTGSNIIVDDYVTNTSILNTSNFNARTSNSSVVNNVVLDDYFIDGSLTTTNNAPSQIQFNTPNGLFDLANINVVVRAEVRILAVNMANGDCKEWKGSKIIKNLSGTTSTNGIDAITSVFSDAGMSGCTANMGDDLTPPSLAVYVNGLASTTINWKCYIHFIKTII